MEMQNLWPDFPIEEVKGPKAILDKQAEYLAKKTGSVLTASVIPVALPNGERIQHSLFIVAPLLDNYRYKLLSISYDLAVNYPLYLTWRYESDAKKVIYTEEEFTQELSMIFSDKTTMSIVSSLLAQSRSEVDSE